eukprot:TRINITY_DN33471_c0_g1_i1.p1 TRINITY_DN33471_c0_g1~~TRINITY_DN33471_c0_g1_i1.p1  ORF type:complete len:711 (+),score=94.54 TRINITY_DN33471_c0_g1_i1:71-2203(+)
MSNASPVVHPTLLGGSRMLGALGCKQRQSSEEENGREEATQQIGEICPAVSALECHDSPAAALDGLGPRVRFSVKNTFVELEDDSEAIPANRKAYRRAHTTPVEVALDSDSDEDVDMRRYKSDPSNYNSSLPSSEHVALKTTHDDSIQADANVAEVPFKCVVKNTFVEVDDDDDETSAVRRNAHRRIKTTPVEVALDSDSDEQGREEGYLAEQQGDIHSSSLSIGTGAGIISGDPSHLTTCTSPHNEMLAPHDPVFTSAQRFDLEGSRADPMYLSADSTSDTRVRFSVKNTFVEVTEDDSDGSPSAAQPQIRRAGTDPLGLKAPGGNHDSVTSIATGHSDECSDDDCNRLVNRVWELSQESEGCWAVQRALDAALSEEERETIANELRGHVWDALQHHHANFVLQKCISTLHPQSTQFIVDEIANCGSVSLAARSRCGCRVVQRLLEHCSRAQTAALGEDLLMEAMSNCQHRFARYVMQCLVSHGSCQQVQRLAELLVQNISDVCLDEHACSVVIRILAPDGGSRANRELVSSAILETPGLGTQMRRSRVGSTALKLAIQVARDAGKRISSQGRARLSEQARDGFSHASNGSAVEVSARLVGSASDASNVRTRRNADEGAVRQRRRGAGGGEFAQAIAEARDLLASLQCACDRRNPHRIAKAVQRLESATMAPGAAPVLLAEAPMACFAARTLLMQLSAQVVLQPAGAMR